MRTFEERTASRTDITNNQQAIETINDFFQIFHPVEVKEEIDIFLRMVEENNGIDVQKKEELIYFCNKLEEVMKAAELLVEKK